TQMTTKSITTMKKKINSVVPRRLVPSLLALLLAATLSGCVINLPGVTGPGELSQRIVRPSSTFFSNGKILLVDISGVIGANSGGINPFANELDMVALVS